MLSLAIVPASFLKLLVELNTQFHTWVHVFHFNCCISIIRDFKMSPMLLKGIKTGSGGVCCPNARGKQDVKSEGRSPRDLTYCSHKPECIGTTNPTDRS